MNAMEFGHRLRGLIPGKVVVGFLLAACAVTAQDNIYWTGGGGDGLWGNSTNWNTGILPGSNDVVHLGHPDYTADAAQTVTLDVTGVEIGSLYLQGTGDRTVLLTAADSESLLILNADMLRMTSNATAAATINVQLHNNANFRTLRNDSATALLTFDQLLRSSATGTDYFDGEGTLLFNAGWADKSYTIGGSPTIILNLSGTIARAWQPGSGSDATLLLGGNAYFSRRWSNAGDFSVASYNDASARILYFGYGVTASGTMTITNSVYGGTGPIEVQVGRISGFTFSRNAGRIVTREGDTVSIARDAPAGTTQTVAWSPVGARVTGSGNFWLRGGGAGTNLLESALDYTGRTLISSGQLALQSYTPDDTTYYGSLPAATILEIGSSGHFHLNGIDQTLGGIEDYRGFDKSAAPTAGFIYLNGATLTINAATNSSFSGGGKILGAGALVKSGSQTFTLSAGYTNAAGRTLRVADGLLAVTGALTIEEGTFELTGGFVTAGMLSTTGLTWNVTLGTNYEEEVLVDVTDADITGAALILALAGGYTPVVGTTYTLLRAADEILGASPGGTLFGYDDGEVFTAGGQQFQIDWSAGSENIVLTAIPEPGALTLLGLAAALGILLQRRRG